LPYIDLYEQLNEQEKQRLVASHGKVLDNEEKGWIRSKMDDFKIIERSYTHARALCDEAIEAIGEEIALRVIIESVIQRSH
jgi:octaprenyl-diphosphate synthase